MRNVVALLGLTALVSAPMAQAQVSDQEFNDLKETLEQALERINELEDQQGPAQSGDVEPSIADQVKANTARLSKMDWAERIKFYGDFRYRYQYDDVDPFRVDLTDPDSGNTFSDTGGDDTRNRNRIRARLGMTAEVTENWEVGFGFASGGDDPVSTNQTLGGGGSTKDINLDMAYFDYTGIANTSIRGGKFKNTFKKVSKSQLQWDGDWRPEGFDIAWENDMFFAQGLGTWLESDSRDSNSDFSYLLQAGTKLELGPVKLMAGAGFSKIDAEGEECFYEIDDGGCFGNETVVEVNALGEVTNAVYVNDFEVYNVFAEAGFKLGNLPVKVFGDYIQNDDADDYDTGYLVGFELGKIKNPGDWKVKAYYEDLESNATLALLSNSDFGGGGTNGKGSVISAGYGVAKNVEFGLTYYMVEKNSDNRDEINNGEDFDINTLQADLKFKFK